MPKEAPSLTENSCGSAENGLSQAHLAVPRSRNVNLRLDLRIPTPQFFGLPFFQFDREKVLISKYLIQIFLSEFRWIQIERI
jgi:hypothetical protein